jgi:hypothetical protein
MRAASNPSQRWYDQQPMPEPGEPVEAVDIAVQGSRRRRGQRRPGHRSATLNPGSQPSGLCSCSTRNCRVGTWTLLHVGCARGTGSYTIGSSGHEGNAAVAAALRVTDPALLHYRSGAFYAERARMHREQGNDHVEPVRDVLRTTPPRPVQSTRPVTAIISSCRSRSCSSAKTTASASAWRLRRAGSPPPTGIERGFVGSRRTASMWSMRSRSRAKRRTTCERRAGRRSAPRGEQGVGILVGVAIVPARPCWLRVASHDQAEDRLRCRRDRELVAANEGWNGRGRRLCRGAGRARAREPWRKAVRCAAWRSPQGFPLASVPLASVRLAADGCVGLLGRLEDVRECRARARARAGSSVIVRGSCVIRRSLFTRIDR